MSHGTGHSPLDQLSVRALAAFHLKDLPLPQPSCLSISLLANPALKILSANIKTLGEIEKKPKLRGSVWHAKVT